MTLTYLVSLPCLSFQLRLGTAFKGLQVARLIPDSKIVSLACCLAAACKLRICSGPWYSSVRTPYLGFSNSILGCRSGTMAIPIEDSQRGVVPDPVCPLILSDRAPTRGVA